MPESTGGQEPRSILGKLTSPFRRPTTSEVIPVTQQESTPPEINSLQKELLKAAFTKLSGQGSFSLEATRFKGVSDNHRIIVLESLDDKTQISLRSDHIARNPDTYYGNAILITWLNEVDQKNGRIRVVDHRRGGVNPEDMEFQSWVNNDTASEEDITRFHESEGTNFGYWSGDQSHPITDSELSDLIAKISTGSPDMTSTQKAADYWSKEFGFVPTQTTQASQPPLQQVIEEKAA